MKVYSYPEENTVLKILSINVTIPMLCKEEQTHALEDYIETSNATKVVIYNDIAAGLVASLPARQ